MYQYGLTYKSQLGFELCDRQQAKFEGAGKLVEILAKGSKNVGGAAVGDADWKLLSAEEAREEPGVVEIGKWRKSPQEENNSQRQPGKVLHAPPAWNSKVVVESSAFDSNLRPNELRREMILEKGKQRRSIGIEEAKLKADWDGDVKNIGGLFGAPPKVRRRVRKKKKEKKVAPYTSLSRRESDRPALWEPRQRQEAPIRKQMKESKAGKSSSPTVDTERETKKGSGFESENCSEEQRMVDMTREGPDLMENIVIHAPRIEQQGVDGSEVEVTLPDTPLGSPLAYSGVHDIVSRAIEKQSELIFERVENLVDKRLFVMARAHGAFKQQETSEHEGVKSTVKRREKEKAGSRRIPVMDLKKKDVGNDDLTRMQIKQAEQVLERLNNLTEFEKQLEAKWAHLVKGKQERQTSGTVQFEATVEAIKQKTAPTMKQNETSEKIFLLNSQEVRSILDGKCEFSRHRAYVEAALAGTGMQQYQIVESLADTLFEAYLQKVSEEVLSTCDDLAELLLESV